MTAVNKYKIKSLIKYVEWFLFGKTNIFEGVWLHSKRWLKTNLSSTYSALNINFAMMMKSKYFMNKKIKLRQVK